MSQLETILGDTDQALEDLNRAGVTHVEVSRETLEELGHCSSVRPGRVPSAAAETAATTMDTGAEMRRLEAEAKKCVKCAELSRCRNSVVFGVGNIHAELMFIGEAPGA